VIAAISPAMVHAAHRAAEAEAERLLKLPADVAGVIDYRATEAACAAFLDAWLYATREALGVHSPNPILDAVAAELGPVPVTEGAVA
jgi:hypothetical protein